MNTYVHLWSYLAQLFLQREKFQTKVVEKIETHILCSITFFKKNRVFYEKMWKSIVEPDRPRKTIWHMRIACWIPKATNTHSKYVILITFTLQQWLHERTSLLLYTYIASLVGHKFHSTFVVFMTMAEDVYLCHGERYCLLLQCVFIIRQRTWRFVHCHEVVQTDTCSQQPIPPTSQYEFHATVLKPLKTKSRLLYLKIQFVPRSKHFSSRL